MKTSLHKGWEQRIERLNLQNRKLTESVNSLKNKNQTMEKDLGVVRKLLNEIPGAVILIQNEKIVFCNEDAWKQLGYTKNELLSYDIPSLVESRSAELITSILQDWAADKFVPERFEFYMRKKDGGSLCCEANWKKIKHFGRIAFLINVVDLKQRKYEEKKIRLSMKINAIATMASGLSNNFNRGLKFFTRYTTSFQHTRPAANQETTQLLRRFDAALENGYDLSRRLKCLSKFKNQDSEVVVFDPKDIALDAVDITFPKLKENRENNITVTCHLRTLSLIEGHQEEIRDAFVNMLLNAIDAVSDGGDIYVTAEENSGFAWIYIQDSGHGISDDIIDKIFDPFFTTKDNRHIGLGLSLAYAIINRNGGEIEVLSHEGQGSTFIVKLPLLNHSVSSEIKRVANRIMDSHVLLVSSGNLAADLMVQMFVIRGSTISTVYSCREGLKLLKRKNYDLLVVDVDTLDFEQTGIVPRIRGMKKNLPVVLLNAGENARQSKDLKADLIIKRPMVMDAIFADISDLRDSETIDE